MDEEVANWSEFDLADLAEIERERDLPPDELFTRWEPEEEEERDDEV